jgi:hypothetical protein
MIVKVGNVLSTKYSDGAENIEFLTKLQIMMDGLRKQIVECY